MVKTKPKVETKVQENFTISKEMDIKFRDAVYRKKGMKKGALAECFEDAVKLWIKENEKNE